MVMIKGLKRVYIEGIEHKTDTMPLEVKDLVPGKNYDICVVSETTEKLIDALIDDNVMNITLFYGEDVREEEAQERLLLRQSVSC